MAWRELKAKIDAENKRILDTPPEDVVKVVKYRIVKSRAGTDDNIMGEWFYALTDVRYVVAYLYHIITASMDPGYTLDQLKYLTQGMEPKVAEFVGYAGFPKIWEYMKGIITDMKEIDKREDFVELLNSMMLYASHLNAWIHYYFPWNISYTYPHRTPEQVREMAKLIGAK